MDNIFESNVENFGIIFKGKSVEKINKIYENYDQQLFVNNFDKEYNLLKKCFLGKKRSAQLVNRLATAVCSPVSIYREVGIKDVILSKPKEFSLNDKSIFRSKKLYKNIGLKTHWMDINCMRYAENFGNNPKKYRQTGPLAIVWVLDYVKPKNLWLIGLDFYQNDYLCRRPHQSPLKTQQEKMKNINIFDNFMNIIIDGNPNTVFHIVTYYDFPKRDNLEVV